jgi:hypothetical protein
MDVRARDLRLAKTDVERDEHPAARVVELLQAVELVGPKLYRAVRRFVARPTLALEKRHAVGGQVPLLSLNVVARAWEQLVVAGVNEARFVYNECATSVWPADQCASRVNHFVQPACLVACRVGALERCGNSSQFYFGLLRLGKNFLGGTARKL